MKWCHCVTGRFVVAEDVYSIASAKAKEERYEEICHN